MNNSKNNKKQQTKQAKYDGPKKFTKRDRLVKLQQQAQAIWAQKKPCQVDPQDGKKQFFVTFPYPYLNGALHLGHAYSASKCDFTARYKALQGYNVLFPFAFHCTGMPISAAAERIKYEISQYGNPPVLPPPPKMNDGNIREWQWTILEKSGINKQDIPKFGDAYFWTSYFPPIADRDLKAIGSAVDWRRSFITTDVNPYYNSFIEWQFTLLKEKGYISYGKRPSIYCIKDKQMCADHDRAEGEGATPQEYTLIKLQINKLPESLEEQLKGKKVFLVAATLRPETMYGQTNCYILPTGVYGAFDMKDDEVFICSDRSALNMSFQGLTKVPEKVEKITDVPGSLLLGLPLQAPLSVYQTVYALPMMTISMLKGTGIVTSVPSDSPDDWAALNDLRKKPDMRTKFGISEDMVKFEPVPIIEIPGLGKLAAITVYEEFQISSQNDQEKLKQAKEKVYTAGFYEGVLLVGDHKGKKVQDAKIAVKKDLIEARLAANYYEPDAFVLSRSGEECIVAFCDQWYLSYNLEDWKVKIREHVQTSFNCYNQTLQNQLLYTIDWLKEWGCSRSFGLGTRLPFDKQYLVESLSDSTIYFAYYTIAHYLQGDVYGKVPGLLGVKAEDLGRPFWDYVLLGQPYDSVNSKIPEEKLIPLKKEFNYWYPLDMRCSAKDLIRNHLTMALFNHAAIWQDPKYWPRSFFCNGYIMVNGEKMSKSQGNFRTVRDIVDRFGADGARMGIAEAGDTLDDANFVDKIADDSVAKIFTLEEWIDEFVKKVPTLRTSSEDVSIQNYDRAFESEIQTHFNHAIQAYEEMRFRDVMKYGFHSLTADKDEYLISCGKQGPRRDLILLYIEYQLLIMYPIIPHFCEITYRNYLLPNVDRSKYPEFLWQAKFPTIDSTKIDHVAVRSHRCIKRFLHKTRQSYMRLKTNKKNLELSKLVIIFAPKFLDWQIRVLQILSQVEFDDELRTRYNWRDDIKKETQFSQDIITKMMVFGSVIVDMLPDQGREVLEPVLPFEEFTLLQNIQSTIKEETNTEVIEFITYDQALERKTTAKNCVYAAALERCIPGSAQTVFEEKQL